MEGEGERELERARESESERERRSVTRSDLVLALMMLRFII